MPCAAPQQGKEAEARKASLSKWKLELLHRAFDMLDVPRGPGDKARACVWVCLVVCDSVHVGVCVWVCVVCACLPCLPCPAHNATQLLFSNPPRRTAPQAAKVDRLLEWLEAPAATSEVDLAAKASPAPAPLPACLPAAVPAVLPAVSVSLLRL